MHAITTQRPPDACCDACGMPATRDEDTALAIACSLGAGDFKARVAGIEALARRSLRTSRREPLKLHLTFAPEALPEVQDLVAKETDCCAFLDFDLRAEPGTLRLTITAPAAALSAADELFAHFAPHLATETVR